MLIRFVVSNFLSFKEETEFNMLTGSFKLHNEHVYTPSGGVEVLRAAAIYGANGAGKSNLMKAFSFAKEAIVKGKFSAASIKHKASKEYLSKPSSFELEFIAGASTYSYGFTIDHNKILEEFLIRIRPYGKNEIIFNRTVNADNRQSLELHSDYTKTEQDKLRKELFEKEFLVTDKLFLHVAANLKENRITEVNDAFQWISERLIIIFPNSRPTALLYNFLFTKRFNVFSNQMLCGFDTGITSIYTKTIPIEQFFGEDDKEKAQSVVDKLKAGQNVVGLRSGHDDVVALFDKTGKAVIKKLYTQHRGENDNQIEFEIREESEGTQRLLDFIPALYAMLFNAAVVLIDEIDKSIHPFLLKSLIKKVMKEKRIQGQLIFNTHESNLLDLDIFRQDEIWFAEKDTTGATDLYSLSDFKPRFDFDIRKGYLNGRYGAIPFLANLADLKWEQYAEEEQGV